MNRLIRLALAPVAFGLTVLDKAMTAVYGTPPIPPAPVVVLDEVGPWAGWTETL